MGDTGRTSSVGGAGAGDGHGDGVWDGASASREDQTVPTVVTPISDVVPGAELECGESAGRYVIEELIGSGGMGAVYRAFDPELSRRVALKVLSVRHRILGADPTVARARLEREAQAMAQLSHPNVVAIHDVGRFDDDLFIAMELVDGQTLKQWCRATTRTRAEILDVFCAAGRGLAAAHRAGMVHRDFKPDNVLIGSDGRVRVADFGLARAADAAANDDDGGGEGDPVPTDGVGESAASRDSGLDWGSRSELTPSFVNTPLTQAGDVLGTPAYMAPEQYAGTAVDAATDQFSFCVALYEALYGERPFAGQGPRALRRAVMANDIAAAPAGTRVPAWLRAVLLRGLAVAPSDRFPTMDALLSELRRDPARARRRAVGAVAAALFAVVLGAGWLRSTGPDETTSRCRAPERWLEGVWDDGARASLRSALGASGIAYAGETAERLERVLDGYARQWAATHTEACEATHVHGTQSDRLLDLRMSCLERSKRRVSAFVELMTGPLDAGLVKNSVKAAVSSTELTACSDERALHALSAYPLPADPNTRARVERLEQRIDELRLMLVAGQFRDGAALGDEVLAEADALEYAPAQARARRVVGTLIQRTGDTATAEKLFARGVSDAARAGDAAEEARLTAKRIWVLGHLMGRHEPALALVPSAEAAIVRAGDTPMLRQELLSAIGAVYFTKREFARARKHWEKRLDLFEAAADPLDPALGWAFNNLGAVLLSLRDYEGAIERLERARGIWETTLGPEHPAIGALSNNLGIAYRNLGRLDEAAAAQRHAIAVLEGVHGASHVEVARAVNNLGSTLRSKRDFAGAEEQYRRALEIQEQQPPPITDLNGIAHENVGFALQDQGKYEQAAEHYRRAIAVYRDLHGRHHPRTGATYHQLGSALLATGDLAGAVSALEQSLAILEAVESDLVPDVRIDLAKALWRQTAARKRARRLAQTARDEFARRPDADDKVVAVDAWLQAHRGR